MKVLLLGEYSNLHWTLAEGLRQLGHHVTVASDGDGFKNYNRDIDLYRKSSGIGDTFNALGKVMKNLDNFKGYDIVQLINPCFTQLNVNINRHLYRFLRKNNKKVFLGAFGIDSYWIHACMDGKTFRYSEFFVNGKETGLKDINHLKSFWLNTGIEELNNEIVRNCDGIIACMYEYYASYASEFSDKLAYIPFPVNLDNIEKTNNTPSDRIKFFVGINKARNEFKGTDKLHEALIDLYAQYSDEIDITVTESIQYNQYLKIIATSDVVLDQIYSYSPAMNGLLAMSMGKVLVSGAEPEMYELLNEKDNKPIINVFPTKDDIYSKLESIVLNKQNIKQISDNSRLFVEKHHQYIDVAQQYLDFWNK